MAHPIRVRTRPLQRPSPRCSQRSSQNRALARLTPRAGMKSVLRRSLDTLDDQYLDWRAHRLQLEAQLLVQGRDQRCARCGIKRTATALNPQEPVVRQLVPDIEAEPAHQRRAIEDGP